MHSVRPSAALEATEPAAAPVGRAAPGRKGNEGEVKGCFSERNRKVKEAGEPRGVRVGLEASPRALSVVSDGGAAL